MKSSPEAFSHQRPESTNSESHSNERRKPLKLAKLAPELIRPQLDRLMSHKQATNKRDATEGCIAARGHHGAPHTEAFEQSLERQEPLSANILHGLRCQMCFACSPIRDHIPRGFATGLVLGHLQVAIVARVCERHVGGAQ